MEDEWADEEGNPSKAGDRGDPDGDDLLGLGEDGHVGSIQTVTGAVKDSKKRELTERDYCTLLFHTAYLGDGRNKFVSGLCVLHDEYTSTYLHQSLCLWPRTCHTVM